MLLGIETSCDDTAVAVLDPKGRVLSNVVSSQHHIHGEFGGIVPELASRRHIEMIRPVTDQALDQAGVGLEAIRAVAVTQGPGLVGSLLVGFCFGRALAHARGLPCVGVDHMAAHLLAVFLEHRPAFPYIALIVSGGNTALYRVDGPRDFILLGRSRDDAAGEAFDKTARLLGLGYPGGPEISRMAAGGDPGRIAFPRAWLDADSLDFSFSGLKTSVAAHVERQGLDGPGLAHVCASFQEAVVEVLAVKTLRAVRQQGVPRVVLGGGVAANACLRRRLEEDCARGGVELHLPSPALCTDNGAMIALAGRYLLEAGEFLGPEADVFSRSTLG